MDEGCLLLKHKLSWDLIQQLYMDLTIEHRNASQRLANLEAKMVMFCAHLSVPLSTGSTEKKDVILKFV